MIRYEEPADMYWIANLMCCSERTASRRLQPLRKHLGLRRNESFTKQQVLDYLGK